LEIDVVSSGLLWIRHDSIRVTYTWRGFVAQLTNDRLCALLVNSTSDRREKQVRDPVRFSPVEPRIGQRKVQVARTRESP
jgi:hypothetical protein